jgi:ribose transport system ATP-binding protein
LTTATATATSLHVEHLSKTFPGQVALSDVTLDLRTGEVHCILGQNGSGKSTFIKVLSGYHSPDPGTVIRVGDTVAAKINPTESRQLGLRFVHQQAGIVSQLSAVENVALGIGFSRGRAGIIDWKSQEARTRELLSLVGRGDIDIWQPMSRARAVDRTAVAIARAIDPTGGEIRFLFLDEPTAALPPTEVDYLCELIERVRDRGIGVVYVTHRLDEVFRVGDRVSVLRDAKLLGTWPIADIDHDQLVDIIVGPALDQGAEAGTAAQTAPGDTAEAVTSAVTPHSPPGAGSPVVSVRSLRSELLRDLSFDLHAGEVVGVAGLAGSGREELPYALIGAIPSTVQALEVHGHRVTEPLTPRRAKQLGLLLAPGNRQLGSAVAKFAVRENLTLPSMASYTRLLRVVRRRERSVSRDWIRELSIRCGERGEERSFAELSGGNQQKVIIAKWLNMRPTVLALDEPTSGVDVGAREAIYAIIRHHAREGMAVLLASSDFQDFAHVCSRVLVLWEGAVVAELTGAQVTEDAILATVMGGRRDTTTSEVSAS